MAKRKAPMGATAIERPEFGSPHARDMLNGMSVEELADVTNALMDAIMVIERAMGKARPAVFMYLDVVRVALEREVDRSEHDLGLRCAATMTEARIQAEIAIRRAVQRGERR